MKNLQEKKRLARMARNAGMPDLALEESIRREEELQTLVEVRPPKVEVTPPKVEVEKPMSLVDQAAAAIHAAPTEKQPLQEKIQYAELSEIRKMLNQLRTHGNLSWGGGGTGVVRFVDLDDHQHPRDIRYLEFHPEGTDIPPPSGSIAWNPVEECLDVHQPDGTTLQAGLETYIRVYNNTGATLNHGQFVAFGGIYEPASHQEHAPLAVPFIADNSIDPLYVIGVMTEELPNGEFGRATTLGKVRDVDTGMWNVGDLLWASPTTPGALTNAKPTAPDLAVSVAAVMHSGNTDGVLLVRPQILEKIHFAKFSDTTQQTAAGANSVAPVTFNTEDISCSHIHVDANATGNIILSEQGLYEFSFRLQVRSTNASRSNIWIWARKNGTDIANSATQHSIESNGGVIAPAWAFIESMQANDVFQLMWAVDATAATLFSPAATAFAPATPSATLTVKQVAQ
jgi:hypothetical protein